MFAILLAVFLISGDLLGGLDGGGAALRSVSLGEKSNLNDAFSYPFAV
jgi:hypothetical protein